MRRTAQPGFTLLEVVVAIAILAVSLLAIVNINAQAVSSHVYAKKLTIATLLARSKMTDLEQDLYDKPLPADDEEQSGDFSDEGWSQYKWRSKVVVPKTNGLTPEQLFGALFNMPLGDGKDPGGGLMGMLFGGGKPPGAPTSPANPQDPNAAGAGLMAALGPMAGMANAQFTQMVDQLQKSVREVHLTVSWKEGKLTESIDLVTHVVSMGPGSDRNGGAVAAAGGSAGPAGEQWVRADNGMPVPNPKPSATGVGMVDPVDNSPLMSAAQWAAQRGGLPAQPFMLPGNMPKPMVPQGIGTVITGGQKAIIQPRPGNFQ